MPLSYSEIISNNIQICIWQITEDEVFLSSGLSLSKVALERLSSRKSEVHRKGYLAIRQLLKGCGITAEIHQYDQDGAPFLTDGRYLSITHTKNMAAIAISFFPVGIDLDIRKNQKITLERITLNFSLKSGQLKKRFIKLSELQGFILIRSF
jgi:4'-phosphopantetheinyl transferase